MDISSAILEIYPDVSSCSVSQRTILAERETHSQYFMMTRVFGPPTQITRTGPTPCILPKRLHPSRANLAPVRPPEPEVDPRHTTSNHPLTYRRPGEVIRLASILKWDIPTSPSEPDFRLTIPTPESPCLPVAPIHSLYFCRRSNQYPRLIPAVAAMESCSFHPTFPKSGLTMTGSGLRRSPMEHPLTKRDQRVRARERTRSLVFLFRNFKLSIKE